MPCGGLLWHQGGPRQDEDEDRLGELIILAPDHGLPSEIQGGGEVFKALKLYVRSSAKALDSDWYVFQDAGAFDQVAMAVQSF